MVPVCSCAHQIAAFLECCRTWLLPTDWPELESPTVRGCREVRQHRRCYILNIPASSLEQAPAATKGVWSSLWLHFSYKGREKNEVLSGHATCFYGAFYCVYNILVALLLLLPRAKAVVTWLLFVAYQIPFLLIWWPDVCLARKKYLGCLAVFEKLLCYCFLSSMLGASFHFTMQKCCLSRLTWSTSEWLNCENVWKPPILSVLLFLVIDGAEKRNK